MAHRFAILASLSLLLAVRAQAQLLCPVAAPEEFVVTGRIIAPGVTWQSYYEVLMLNETQLITYTYTNSTGQYTFPAQPAGRYMIVARIDGFKDYRERISLGSCERLFTYTIFMEPAPVEILPVILDFTGEVKEVVDVAELKRKFPKNLVDEFERARSERLRGEPEKALRRLEKLLGAAPDFYDAHNVLGSIYLEMKRYREAEAEFNKARDLNPGSAAPLVSLGSLYMQEAEASLNPEQGVAGVLLPGGDLGVILDDARSVLEEALRIKPDAAFGYYLLGIAHTRGADYVKAEDYLKKTLELESRLRWARLGLANLYMKQNRWKEALAEFDAYLKEFPRMANRDEVQAARKKVASQVAARVQ